MCSKIKTKIPFTRVIALCHEIEEKDLRIDYFAKKARKMKLKNLNLSIQTKKKVRRN